MGCGASKPEQGAATPSPKARAKAREIKSHPTRISEEIIVNGSSTPGLIVPPVPGQLPADSTIIFVLGGPGSGKGTQCDRIKARYSGVVHLSAGDLLRAEVASGSAVGAACEALMKEGKLVPVSVTIQLLKNAMILSKGSVFLIDGFPRALDQAAIFEKDIGMPKAVLFFDCPEEEMERRLLKRGETSGRSDDNAETIRKRFKTFVEQSLPVKGHYEAKHLAHVISAVATPDVVFEDVCKALDPIMKKQQASSSSDLVVPPVPGSLPTDAKIIFVLGGPGSGKGTQCDRIKTRYSGVIHLSAGDLLRAEVASGSAVGAACEALMKEGKLVPVSVTIALLKNAMILSKGSVFLIDGFPRALDQADVFETGIGMPKAVLFFDCPEEEMERRLLKRGETSGRSDDNAETIRKRFKTFVEQSLPVKGHYEAKHLAHVISSVPAPDVVFEDVCKALDPVLSKASSSSDLVVPPVPGSLPTDAKIIFVLGGPGSGKGTQCDRIKTRYSGVIHLSAGDLLRAEVASGSAVGAACEALMKEGKLVPVSVTIALLKNAMILSKGSVFLIDGFPRALDQADVFESGIGMPKAVLFFDCPEEEMERRLLKRGETSGRSDDNAETIRKRFKTFVEQSLPVKGHYEAKHLAHVISSVPAPDVVFEDVCKALDPVLSKASSSDLVVPPVPGSLPTDAKIIFVLGGPGSGKGTQCDRIKARYSGVIHLSAGDLLRAEVASGSAVGAACEALMKEGKLVPVSVTIALLKNAMILSKGSVFLIDGFPRALDQADVFESGIGMPKAVLFFDCPEEEMERRLLKRGETSGRSDDNAETIRKRFKTFVEQSLPVKGHYEAKHLAHVISSVPAPDVVFEEVCKALDPVLSKASSSNLVVPPVPGSLPTDAKIIFVLGGPGSGKGTQCDRIKTRYSGVIHLSAGDLLRAEVASGSAVGAACEALMKEGKLVPVSVTIALLKNAMILSKGSVFLIDGFPRALDQAEVFETGIGMPKAVLFFDCPEEEMERRLLKRGETSGRSDDNAETIRKRFKTFVEQSLPVKGHYEAKHLAHVISSVPAPDVVFEEVCKALDPVLSKVSKISDDLVVPVVPGGLPADATIVFVLGGPGSGKGTQCDRIKARYDGVIHLSAGDLLRAEVASGSAVGAACEALMKEGKLVPVSVTIALLKNAMILSKGSFFLIDGFPRALDQADVFETGIGMPKAVLFFDCPEEEMEKRLLIRGETSGRNDDNAETIRKRFKTFVEQSLPVKGHYEAKGLAHVISATPTPEVVFEDVCKALDTIATPMSA